MKDYVILTDSCCDLSAGMAEELELAVADGVNFLELVAPVEQKDGKLRCEKMKLGDPDEKGRRKPEPTGEFVEIECDTVISAVGEKVESELFTASGVEVDAKGLPDFRTNVEGVYAGGDAMRGPATVVEGIADAAAFAGAVTGEKREARIPCHARASRESSAVSSIWQRMGLSSFFPNRGRRSPAQGAAGGIRQKGMPWGSWLQK